MAFGTPGADTQPQAQLQFFLNVAEFGMTVQQALEQPSIVSTGFRARTIRTTPRARCRFPALHSQARARRARRRWATSSISATSRGVGSVKAIMIHPKTGVLMGGVSPTRDSYVMAY